MVSSFTYEECEEEEEATAAVALLLPDELPPAMMAPDEGKRAASKLRGAR